MEVTIILIWMANLGMTLQRKAFNHQGQEVSPRKSSGDPAQFEMMIRVRAEASALPFLGVNGLTRRDAQPPVAVASWQLRLSAR